MKTLLCLSGSLRAASSSRALTEALRHRLDQTVRTTTFDIARLPHYNADLTDDPQVAVLKQAIAEADGMLIVTPEYNYSIPGGLKNAIDWASRPAYKSVFAGKPVFVASTSGGALGGVRAQAHLKYILNGMLARVHVGMEVVVPHANLKVVDGVFADPAVLDFALAQLGEFIATL
jgi:chromate reductase